MVAITFKQSLAHVSGISAVKVELDDDIVFVIHDAEKAWSYAPTQDTTTADGPSAARK